MARFQVQPRILFAGVVVALILSSLLPLRFTGWLSGVRGPVGVVLAPIASPMSKLSVAVRPIETRGAPTEAAEELAAQRDELRLLYERAAGRVNELERLVADLQQLPEAARSVDAVSVLAERVGRSASAGTIDVRGGTGLGSVIGTIAVARRTNQLVGVVTQVNAGTSTIRLVTDERVEPGIVRAVLSDRYAESPEQQALLPWADFKPDGEGKLVAEQVALQEGWPPIVAGMTARVDDPDWPAEAQFYTLGVVTDVEEGDAPQFLRLTVSPLIDVSRVQAVLLRIRRESGLGTQGNGLGGGS